MTLNKLFPPNMDNSLISILNKPSHLNIRLSIVNPDGCFYHSN